MSLNIGQSAFLLPNSIFRPRIIPSLQYPRAWKRRRLKPLLVLNLMNPDPLPLEDLFHGLLSQVPSGNSLSYIAPTLGLLSGLALFFSSNSQTLITNYEAIGKTSSDIGEWILFTSPTPFYRFVTLRCPSICLPESELMENLNEKLVKEDDHYVKLKTGGMISPVERDADADANIEYQRVCVGAGDGGVLSLDWPASLDLEEERGLDSTVLIIAGTAEGSNETRIRVFVCECLRRGFFPVVMNPRGCAGSPLTTARLFTAADSDDVTTAVQFINTKRPLTTLMGVGWGYGANMLTKHLAECGEKTPFTAATCIDNPFDLEENTRSLYHLECGQRHTDGLIKILERNKELFQGWGKGFDVEGALSAPSIREFDRAISVVSHGFNAIEDFYAKCSTRYVVGNVKVPVLFIQNDDGKLPSLSVPRDLIAKNSYTSLLLCHYSPSSKILNSQLLFSWCQHVTLEWLAAVELALLKGRHPLLEDDDVTINPAKGLSLVESRDSSEVGKIDKFFNLANGNPAMSPLELLYADDIGEIHSKSNGIWNSLPLPGASQQEACINDDKSNSTIDPVVQSAHVVLNMLDITLPDTLSDEQKKRVLNAVEQGETVLKALQDAVPEEVRGKLTTAVSGILQSNGTDLAFDKLSRLGSIPDLASVLNSKVQEKLKKTKVKIDEDAHFVGEAKGAPNDSRDKSPGDVEHAEQSSEIPPEPKEHGDHSGTSLTKCDDLEKVNPTNKGYSLENEELSSGSPIQISDDKTMSVLNSDQEFSSIFKGPDEAEGAIADQRKDERDNGKYHVDTLELNNHRMGLQSDPGKVLEANQTADQSSAASNAFEAKSMDSEAEKNENEEKGPMPTGDPPSFSVSQALDALTGFDDSTQVAVNSVFHVIEDMIDKLEVKKDKDNQVKDENTVGEVRTREVKELSTSSVSDSNVTKNDYRSAKTVDLRINARKHSGNSDCNFFGEEEMSVYKYNQQYYSHVELNDKSSERDHKSNQFGTEDGINFLPGEGKLRVRNSADNNFEKVLSYLATHPYRNPLYKEYLNAYLCLKMRNAEPSRENKMPALHMDYFPEEDQWKLLDPTEENSASVKIFSTNESGSREVETNTNPSSKNTDKIIEPSYIVLDSGKPLSETVVPEQVGIIPENSVPDVMEFEDCKLFIKELILECLKVEVGRRANISDEEKVRLKIVQEMEYIANAVSMAAGKGKMCLRKEKENQKGKIGTIDGKNIVKAISSAIQHTIYLRKLLPVGLVVGASLVELRRFFNIAALGGNGLKDLAFDKDDASSEGPVRFSEKEGSKGVVSKRETMYNLARSTSVDDDLENSQNGEAMVSAVTAAVGASALLAHEKNTVMFGRLSVPWEEKDNSKGKSKPDGIPEKNQDSIVTSLAEKAMSVASPMVPVKEDGELDHDRMVAMLTELGQKGGFLRLFGKVALLWGGMRGAMSLTNKLISFLRIAERPLIQRIPGFVFMVLLLWSPVILPLLPTLVQSWATHNPFKVAEFACMSGLYASTMLMIMLWGKRIRKYEDPLLEYGLDLTSVPKFQNFLKGLLGGIGLIILIHSVNSLLGYAHVCWPTTLHSSASEPVALIRSYGRMLARVVQGFATAIGVSVVEELLFRSWLPQEIAADFGYHHGVVISALAFALSQRSKWGIPGLWLLSLGLSGIRQRSGGCLSLPIGLHAGILASNFILRTGGFVTYYPNLPLWITGGQPFQPFSGVIGLAFSLVWAVILYPRLAVNQRKPNRVIRL